MKKTLFTMRRGEPIKTFIVVTSIIGTDFFYYYLKNVSDFVEPDLLCSN